MSYAQPPTVPPLPQDFYNPPRRQNSNPAPPIPPLPANFEPERQHPMHAPMPERAMPSLPADMARTLDESTTHNGHNGPARVPSLRPNQAYSSQHQHQQPQYDQYHGSSPLPFQSGAGYPGGFARPQSQTGHPPQSRTPIPQSQPHGPGGFVAPHTHSQHSSYTIPPLPMNGSGSMYGSQGPPQSQPSAYGLPSAMENLSLNSGPSYSSRFSQAPSNPYGLTQPGYPLSGSSASPLPELTAPVPTVESLAAAQASFPPNSPPPLSWIRDVLFLVERLHPSSDATTGPVYIDNPTLRFLLHTAATSLLTMLSPMASPHPPEALYLRGLLHASGSCPEIIPKSPREAFKDFEASARGGWSKAWFKLGRDYEGVGDLARARDCFERGVKAGVESCCYRMGMAYLLGQLGLPASQVDALPLLQRAAHLATIECPQPAYVYGLLLLGEFAHVKVDPGLFAGLIPRAHTPLLEARKYIERSAYLGFGAAQYKLGHAYEYAVEPFPSDPLLSVQYYSLASQQGEPEADMALSKWFLCGAEGAFEKDEALAVTFADKAARTGLGSAEFAMGYYAEVGIGGPKDIEAARRWYAKAVEHGNTDAPARLNALSLPSPQALSRTEHDQITDDKLVRRRTQARVDAVRQGRVAATPNVRSSGADAAAAAAAAAAAPAEAEAESEAGRPGPSYGNAPPPQPQQGRQPLQQGQGSYFPQQPANTSPQIRPRPPLEHAPPSATRYSLVDAPSPGTTPPPGGAGNTVSPSGLQGGRAQGRPLGRRYPSLTAESALAGGSGPGTGGTPPQQQRSSTPQPQAPAPQPPRQTTGGGPATFAEMGFQSGKAQDKECVIM